MCVYVGWAKRSERANARADCVRCAFTPSYGSDRITKGREEIQMRKVAGFLFGYMGARTTPGK